MKYIVCYSGGHSSALAAVECVRKYGRENVILLNHDISSEIEHVDIKRFKNEVAKYLGLKITYANMDGYEKLSPLKLCKKQGGFQFQPGNAICTYQLKTMPFYKWLKKNYPVPIDVLAGTFYEATEIIYGFDMNEKHRIQRRSSVLGMKGYRTEFPLAFWERTIFEIEEIGIKRPVTYKIFKHANCIGCLKAGQQHWYIVYCLYPQIFEEAKEAEQQIGYSIIKDVYLEELETKFEKNESERYMSKR